MEVIINEESLVGQYSEDSFLDYCATELIPILDKAEELNASILKDYGTCIKHVTPQLTIEDFIYKNDKRNPIIERLKAYLIQMTREPYWNSTPKTRKDVTYDCQIKDVPNCITEAYERKALLYSFDNSMFSRPFIEILCNGDLSSVRNFYKWNEFYEHLTELNLIVSWNKNSFFVPTLGYLFEVRFREDNHKQAHFHMTKAQDSISLSIPDCDILAGASPDTNKIISWAFKNMDHIIDLWNTYHPDLFINK